MRRCSSVLRGLLSLNGYSAKSWSYSVYGADGPHEVGLVDHLAHDVQVRRLLQVEHLAADQHRRLGETVQSQYPQNGVRLQRNIVVHEQDLLAVSVFQRFVHHPAVSAGAAEVGLVVNREPITQRCGRGGEVGVIAHLRRALVGHNHGTDHLVHQGI